MIYEWFFFPKYCNFNSFSVFEILLKVSEGKPWKETLLEVLPQRKFRIGGKQKKQNKSDEMESDSDDEENPSNNDTNSVS